MITYSKTFWGLHHLLRLYGSAIPRTLPFAFASSGLFVLFFYEPFRGYFQGAFLHPFVYNMFAVIVGFALVFRTNFSYQRYWEGRRELQGLTSALANVCARALAFEAASATEPAQLQRVPSVTHPRKSQQRERERRLSASADQLSAGADFGFGASSPSVRASFSRERHGGRAAAGGGGAGAPAELELSGRRQQQQQCYQQERRDLGASYTWNGALEEHWRQREQQEAAVAALASGPQQQQQQQQQQQPAVTVAPLPALPPLQQPSLALQRPSSIRPAPAGCGPGGGRPGQARPSDPPQGGWQLHRPSWDQESLAGVSAALSFGRPPAEVPHQYLEFRDELLHLASLFHALALQHLRLDWRLDNLAEYDDMGPPPPMDARGLEGHATSLLDLFILRGTEGRRAEYNKIMKLPVIGPISGFRKVLLKQFSEADPKVITDTVFSGLDQGSAQSPRSSRRNARALFRLDFLAQQIGTMGEGGAERVYTAYTWLELLLSGRAVEGGMRWRLPAPITASVWAQLSTALASFEQCRKLVDTPFPFPWAQTIIVCLLIYSVTAPLVIAGYTTKLWLGIVLTFISVLTYWALNEVARDLEDPFIYDPNDLPLARHQYDFNKRVLAAAESVQLALENGGV